LNFDIKRTVSLCEESSVMVEAGNECSLGGAVIIVGAFRTTNSGETDFSRWVFKHAGAGAEGQRA
jgi:hypothetical protein